MGKCNGANLKPIPLILFFYKRLKICDVLELCPDSWHERLRSTSTPLELKVLMRFGKWKLYYCISTYMWSWLSTEFAKEIGVKIHLPALLKQLVQSALFLDITVFPQAVNTAANL
jgi:hypothetical protein